MVIQLRHGERAALDLLAKGIDVEDVIRFTGVSMSRLNALMRRQRVPINRALITNMLLEAYESAETSNEIVNAARELGKLHGLYEPEKTVVIKADVDEAKKQIAELPTEELELLVSNDIEMVAVETPDGVVYEVKHG